MILIEIDGQQTEITGAGEVNLRDLLANKPYLIENGDIKMISHPLHFEVKGLPVNVEYSNRRKRAELVIRRPDATVIIKAPFSIDNKIMENYILQNWNWIITTRKNILNETGVPDIMDKDKAALTASEAPKEDGGFTQTPTPRTDLKSTSNPSSGDDSSNLVHNDKTSTGETYQIDDNKPLYKWEKDGVPVEVIYRNNLKRLKLYLVSPDAHIMIKAPYGTKASKIISFIEQSWSWYIANKHKAVKDEIPMYDYNEGSKLPYLGKEYTIKLILGQKQALAVNHDEELIISCSSKALVPTVVMEWYHQCSEKLIKEYVPKWCKIMGLPEPKVEQKFMVSAWGKCYPKQKKIVLHPQLIFHPKECFEFIVVHELCHFMEANHSPRFYALMDKYLPSWREADQLINSKYILK